MNLRKALTLLAVLGIVAGCSLSPDQKKEREVSLKKAMDKFIGGVVAGDFESTYKLTQGFDNPPAFAAHMKQPWELRTTLATGTVASMAWVGDDAARVKVVWTFVEGAQQSHSAETLIWVWSGGAWKYKGRTLR